MMFYTRKIAVLLAGCFLSTGVTAQNEVKVFFQNHNPGHTLYASNSAFCPISILLDFDLENLRFTGNAKKAFVIPARTDTFTLGELVIVNPRARSRFGYTSKFNYGDIYLLGGDTSYVYDLPIPAGKNFLLYQGYNGSFSHQNENALDFTMPEGTEIVAARDGIVIKVIQENNQSCSTEDCKKYNNSVLVYHADGSFAEYAHIRYNGSKVKVGDNVKKGSVIAYSGNTGWSSGPHLHFVCFLSGMDKRRSITTKFRTNDGNTIAFLKEKQLYMKEY